MMQTTKYIELSHNVKISYFEKGSATGTPLILIHGLADSWRIFELLMPFIPESIHIYAMTQRGHGDSSHPDSGYRIGDFEEDLLRFMDTLNIEKAVILGASSGGFTARRFAINHSERTLALVLVGSPATFQGIPAVRELWISTLSKLKDPITKEFVENFSRNLFFKPVPQEFIEMTLQESLKLPARVWRDTVEDTLEEEFPGNLGKISSPTLIIWGDQDSFLTKSSQEELSKAIPHSKLIVRKDVGHMLYCESPKEIASDIAMFIKEIIT
jgi:non-heme chloroperoxidase